MKIGKWLKRRILEPSSMVAYAVLLQIIAPDFPTENLGMIYDGVTGVLAALGIISRERPDIEED